MTDRNLAHAAMLAVVLALGGCASGVTRPSSAPAEGRVALSSSNQIASVSLSLTEEAKGKITENLKFNPDELLSHVRRALAANSLLNSAADRQRPNLEVRVKDVRIRSNFSAVMWGFMAGSDTIAADIILRDRSGKELDRFEVSASYALGGLAGGQDSARMGWLYEQFAAETVQELMKQ